MIEKTSEKKGRIIEPGTKTAEEQLDLTLRPKTLKEYVGQEKNKEHLNIFLEAAKIQNMK